MTKLFTFCNSLRLSLLVIALFCAMARQAVNVADSANVQLFYFSARQRYNAILPTTFAESIASQYAGGGKIAFGLSILGAVATAVAAMLILNVPLSTKKIVFSSTAFNLVGAVCFIISCIITTRNGSHYNSDVSERLRREDKDETVEGGGGVGGGERLGVGAGEEDFFAYFSSFRFSAGPGLICAIAAIVALFLSSLLMVCVFHFDFFRLGERGKQGCASSRGAGGNSRFGAILHKIRRWADGRTERKTSASVVNTRGRGTCREDDDSRTSSSLDGAPLLGKKEQQKVNSGVDGNNDDLIVEEGAGGGHRKGDNDYNDHSERHRREEKERAEDEKAYAVFAANYGASSSSLVSSHYGNPKRFVYQLIILLQCAAGALAIAGCAAAPHQIALPADVFDKLLSVAHSLGQEEGSAAVIPSSDSESSYKDENATEGRGLARLQPMDLLARGRRGVLDSFSVPPYVKPEEDTVTLGWHYYTTSYDVSLHSIPTLYGCRKITGTLLLLGGALSLCGSVFAFLALLFSSLTTVLRAPRSIHVTISEGRHFAYRMLHPFQNRSSITPRLKGRRTNVGDHQSPVYEEDNHKVDAANAENARKKDAFNVFNYLFYGSYSRPATDNEAPDSTKKQHPFREEKFFSPPDRGDEDEEYYDTRFYIIPALFSTLSAMSIAGATAVLVVISHFSSSPTHCPKKNSDDTLTPTTSINGSGSALTISPTIVIASVSVPASILAAILTVIVHRQALSLLFDQISDLKQLGFDQYYRGYYRMLLREELLAAETETQQHEAEEIRRRKLLKLSQQKRKEEDEGKPQEQEQPHEQDERESDEMKLRKRAPYKLGEEKETTTSRHAVAMKRKNSTRRLPLPPPPLTRQQMVEVFGDLAIAIELGSGGNGGGDGGNGNSGPLSVNNNDLRKSFGGGGFLVGGGENDESEQITFASSNHHHSGVGSPSPSLGVQRRYGSSTSLANPSSSLRKSRRGRGGTQASFGADYFRRASTADFGGGGFGGLGGFSHYEEGHPDGGFF